MSSPTVMGLLNGQDWPLALIVFTASIVFPLVKLLGLGGLMISVQLKSMFRPIDRTKLYRVIEFVGRWSIIDVFVAALLTALVALGSIATIVPGIDGRVTLRATWVNQKGDKTIRESFSEQGKADASDVNSVVVYMSLLMGHLADKIISQP